MDPFTLIVAGQALDTILGSIWNGIDKARQQKLLKQAREFQDKANKLGIDANNAATRSNELRQLAQQMGFAANLNGIKNAANKAQQEYLDKSNEMIKLQAKAAKKQEDASKINQNPSLLNKAGELIGGLFK